MAEAFTSSFSPPLRASARHSHSRTPCSPRTSVWRAGPSSSSDWRSSFSEWHCVVALGQFFTVQVHVRSGQTVVDTGPYQWVRHPSYTAIIMSFVGIGVALSNWLSLLVLIVVPTIGLVIRIRVEEKALLEALGEPYREFSAKRARLVPKVW